MRGALQAFQFQPYGRQRYVAGPLPSRLGDYFYFPFFLPFLLFLLFLAIRLTPPPNPSLSTKC